MTVPQFIPPNPGIAYSQIRSTLWKTVSQQALSGRDNPLALWTYPRWKYGLIFSILRSDSVQANMALTMQYTAAFINTVNGATGIFQYQDPDDHTATAQRFGTGDGVTRTFQLVRAMTSGAASFVEPVWAPVGTPSVFVNGVLSGSYSVAVDGVVTFGVAPAGGSALTWTGTFNWLCRFDTDSVDFEKFMAGMWTVGKLPFTTIKP